MGCNKNKITRINCDIDIFKMELSLHNKVVLAFIHSLVNKKGYCFASNEYFVKKIGVSLRTVTASLQKLEDKGLIVRKTYSTKSRVIKRYIYLTSFKGIDVPIKAKAKKAVHSFTDDELVFFNNMWTGYTVNYVKKIKNSKTGNLRGGGSKHSAKEAFRILLKNNITESQIEDFVSSKMNIDSPQDLQRLLKLGELKEFIKEDNDGMVKLQDIATGEILSLTEEQATKKENNRWKRI